MKMNNLFERDIDFINLESKTELIKKITKFPKYMGVTSKEKINDVFIDQLWGISKTTGAVQLTKLMPLEELYKTTHNPGSVGQLWVSHHELFSDFIKCNVNETILEFGAGHGKLYKNKIRENSFSKWIIYEPNCDLESNSKLEVINNFFDPDKINLTNINTIIHSHVFEHLYNPSNLLAGLQKNLDIGAKIICSIPNLEQMIIEGHANTLSFEHTYFINNDQFIELHSAYGFDLKASKKFKSNHSIFYEFVLNRKNKIFKFNNHFDYNFDIVTKYFEKNMNKAIRLKEITNSKKDVYLFGAHVNSQLLFCQGIELINVKAVFDNDIRKHTKRLYGTDLIVINPSDTIPQLKNSIIVLNNGAYGLEIKKQILDLNPLIEIIDL